jgi:NADH-quinone oxidoreductase subunit E
MERPKGISSARGGKADKLQRISGVGPKNEKVLHNLGFFHFDQISAWTPAEIEWVDDHLKFNGRIKREEWTKQCKLLAAGKEEEFSKLFGTGGMKTKAGQTQSGTRTKK